MAKDGTRIKKELVIEKKQAYLDDDTAFKVKFWKNSKHDPKNKKLEKVALL